MDLVHEAMDWLTVDARRHVHVARRRFAREQQAGCCGPPTITRGCRGGRGGRGKLGGALTGVREAARKRRNGIEGWWRMKLDATAFRGTTSHRDCTGRTMRLRGSSLIAKMGGGGTELAGQQSKMTAAALNSSVAKRSMCAKH
jgi:hypothetical protein